MKHFARPALRAAATLVAALGALATAAAPLAAQTPTTPARPTPARPDTFRVAVPDEAVRSDTLPDRARGDSTARDTAVADSLIAAPNFPELPTLGGPGVWVFTREELSRFHGLNVLELLDRVPGILITRTGNFGRPAGVSPLGAGGGRFRVFLDGWEMRPLNGATLDLQRIPLVDLAGMRVERDLNEVRVDLSTFRLSDVRAFAQIEGADGDFNSRILRGFFARPLGSRFTLQAGLDISESQGFRRLDPFALNTIMGRLSYLLRPELGFQLDFRRSGIDTEQEARGLPGLQESLDRNELILRGRGRFFQRLWLDAAVGRSSEEPAGADSINGSVRSVQGYGRALLDIGIGNVSGAFRVHGGEEGTYAPAATELSARADLAPLPWLSGRGEVRVRTLGDEAGTETDLMVRAGPFTGVTLFGEIGAGVRAIPFLADTVIALRTFGGLTGRAPVEVSDTVSVLRTIRPSLAGLRAGAEFTRGPYQIGAAFVSQNVDDVAPYGFAFDRAIGPAPGGTVAALEGYASVPVISNNLRFDGWFVGRLDAAARRYLPTYFGRGALEFRDVFRDGNLEPLLRVEAVGRGRALIPGTDAIPGDTLQTPVETPRYTVFNLFVQIRIIDVRIFYRLDNAFSQTALDYPASTPPGPRAMYGVRWFFRN